MKKETRSAWTKIIRKKMEMQHPQSIKDIYGMLKDMLAEIIENVLKVRLDLELGYKKNDQQPRDTTNRRTDSYTKTVTSNIGELELDIPRDRNDEYELELISKGTIDINAF